MAAQGTRMSRTILVVAQLSAAFVFFWVVLFHVYNVDFQPLAALCLPILVVFFGFAALLYNRGRALPPGEAQLRSLVAAERAMQATVWYLLGIVLGVVLFGVARYARLTFDPRAPSASGWWLLLFLAPYAMMQTGLFCFMRSAWMITPDLLRRLSDAELRGRVRQPD